MVGWCDFLKKIRNEMGQALSRFRRRQSTSKKVAFGREWEKGTRFSGRKRNR